MMAWAGNGRFWTRKDAELHGKSVRVHPCPSVYSKFLGEKRPFLGVARWEVGGKTAVFGRCMLRSWGEKRPFFGHGSTRKDTDENVCASVSFRVFVSWWGETAVRKSASIRPNPRYPRCHFLQKRPFFTIPPPSSPAAVPLLRVGIGSQCSQSR